MLMDVEFIMPLDVHKQIVQAAFEKRGFTEKESSQAADFSEQASWHGIKTHNALKALHLDHLFGSVVGGCVPGAEVEVLSTSFDAVQAWNGHKKLGQALAYDAMDACMEMADRHGSGIVMIDEAFHYLWGGGYVIDVAKKGYIAYTQCTAALAEVVPFMGKFPTLGTNPHSWAFPTQDLLGYPIFVAWATTTVAMGRVQQIQREGGKLGLQRSEEVRVVLVRMVGVKPADHVDLCGAVVDRHRRVVERRRRHRRARRR